jgi:hypothetical protein
MIFKFSLSVSLHSLSPSFSRLRTIFLTNTSDHLLEQLTLRQTNISSPNAALLSVALRHNTVLEKLALSQNALQSPATDFTLIVRSLQGNQYITVLDLSANKLIALPNEVCDVLIICDMCVCNL